ncbi:hypothetical protein [Desulfohalovibrio reitneri]|uniref:hypothetical protein n=1 Tax=Desulfohalovibrio reitneri TaxID=1307759 RepID=UPI0005568079|nr:hypothetical protein [Desulfohalovibrio reitneri]
MPRALLCITALLLMAAPAAAMNGHTAYQADFQELDASGDGLVEKDEFVEHFSRNTEPGKAFDIIDMDRSGAIDQEEWSVFEKAHNGSGMGHGKEMPHGKMEDGGYGHGSMDGAHGTMDQ